MHCIEYTVYQSGYKITMQNKTRKKIRSLAGVNKGGKGNKRMGTKLKKQEGKKYK